VKNKQTTIKTIERKFSLFLHKQADMAKAVGKSASRE
jgi:hypothetical protein